MSAKPSLEERLAVLEKEVSDLKRGLPLVKPANWFEQVSGSFQNDVEFDEILKLGRAIRQADQLTYDE